MNASSPQSVDPTVGRHLAETVCSTCHQISATSPPGKNPAAPSFVDSGNIGHVRQSIATYNEVEAGGRIIQSLGVLLHEFDVT
jgi:mono/diheme cytochrome c family protein